MPLMKLRPIAIDASITSMVRGSKLVTDRDERKGWKALPIIPIGEVRGSEHVYCGVSRINWFSESYIELGYLTDTVLAGCM